MVARDVRREPLRTCVACRRVGPKSSLVRLVKRPGDSVVVDRTGKAPGRGAYVCDADECARRATGRLRHALRAGRIDFERVRRELTIREPTT
jgi:predicted RNA-binding protein YlxR (DUF448 family)